MKNKIIEILNSYVDSKLGGSEDNISAYAVDSIADEIVNLLPKHLVSKSYSVQQMDDAYDKGYSDCLKNKAC
mgnify:FL=1|tara:strand:- start:8628 stop:8843 length:216 start_codon:yes stop_codon:yes gene_type:complete